MILNLEWMPAVPLRQAAGPDTYVLDREALPDKPGIYIFGRRHGERFEALYVGRAAKIRWRVFRQLNNNRLMDHLLEAQTGQRVVVPGVFVPARGQRLLKCLPILEHTLIRHFLDRGDTLVNKQGVQIRTHDICSSGSNIQHGIPKQMVIDA